ncbi:hypothetical protein M408DRAFT_13284, partial [Serendipita vermifera MAFF 305830]
MHVARPADVRAAGLHPVADAGRSNAEGTYTAPQGHVHITTPNGQQMTTEAATAAMGQVQAASVKVNSHTAAQELLAEAAKDHSKPIKEVAKDIADRKAAEKQAESKRKAAEKAAKKATAEKKDGGCCIRGPGQDRNTAFGESRRHGSHEKLHLKFKPFKAAYPPACQINLVGTACGRPQSSRGTYGQTNAVNIGALAYSLS